MARKLYVAKVWTVLMGAPGEDYEGEVFVADDGFKVAQTLSGATLWRSERAAAEAGRFLARTFNEFARDLGMAEDTRFVGTQAV